MRAFLAVDLDEELRTEIARIQQELRDALSSANARISWVRPAGMHLTVKFLGEFDQRHVEPLRDDVARILRSRTAVTIPLSRVGAFPRPQAPRTIWLGPQASWDNTDDALEIGRLMRAIDEACTKFGAVPDQKHWHPHLTLARVRDGERLVGRALAQFIDRSINLAPLLMTAVTFVQSDLRPDGPVYTRLWDVRLD